jgi:NHLM bacteriocin system ABC transporter ATP-binding protein
MSIPSSRPLDPVSRVARLPQPLRADQPLCLGEMAEPLRVVAGFVDLFAVAMRDGRHVGRRRAVARLSAGDCFWPVPRALDERGDGLGLIAVGGLGAQVEALGDAPALADIDHWLRAILPPAPPPAKTASILAPGRHDLAVGDVAAIQPGQGCLWLVREEGLLSLPDGTGLRDVPVPLVAGRWVSADGTARIALRTSRELADAGLLVPALAAAHAALLRQIAQALDARAADETAQARQRGELSRQGMEAAFGTLVDLIQPGSRLAAPERVLPGWEAGALVRRIAQSLGLELPPPAHAGKEGRPPDLAQALAAARLRQRGVLLRLDWWRQTGLPMVARLAEGDRPVALLPQGNGYVLWDALAGTSQPVDATLAEKLNPQAQAIYAALPSRPVGLGDMIRLGLHGTGRERLAITLLALGVALIGLLTPVASGLIVDKIVPTAAGDQLFLLVLALVVAAISSAALDYSKTHAVLRLQSGIDLKMHAAVIDRLLRLPAGFFKRYTVGDLADRAMGIATIREMLAGAALSSLLGGVMSLVSLGMLFFYSVKLALVALLLVALSLSVTVGLSLLQLRHERQEARTRGIAEGLVLQFITGVAKLKVAAAVDRAIMFWMRRYGAQRRFDIAGQRLARMQTVFQAAFGPLSTVALMAGMVLIAKGVMAEQAVQALAGVEGGGGATAMQAGGFIAFFTAFGQFQGAMTQLVGTLTRLLGVFPIWERSRPLLESPLDDVADGEDAARLGGGVEFAGVSFSYAPDLPPVLDNLSFSIRPGEFVAIVGPSGGGKSTILRLLLGLDRPQAGELFFDGRPMSRLTPDSVRRQIGTVLQNGRLMGGSILDNIVGASAARLEDAWAAARQVDLADDIKAMPMGMHTVLTEGGGTLSGGQRQRLMIARALVRQPRLLLLDEATSALDNRTQAAVMRSLEKLDVTRVMIAHRLSTIERVDRILVIERGRLVEQGRFADLIAQDGVFAALARRQML